ncbi:gas vesicle protein GvpK [Frankia sp. AgB1.8]|uniref:gas vesicle protein GvpK n=1 Tax=unclassified Frankia TaxID=2632575 RepID=UPI0035A843BB
MLLELLRDLLERQAVRRVDSGMLPPAQVEDLGRSLIEVRDAIAQVRDSLGVNAEQARAATARAREMVGEWPPTDLADDIVPATTFRGVDDRGGRGRRSSRAGGRGAHHRPSATPAVGRLFAAGRRHHEQGWPAAGARDPAPPGWDMS